jgi:hypothetical protein
MECPERKLSRNRFPAIFLLSFLLHGFMRCFVYIAVILLITGCKAGKSSFTANRKYAPTQLQKDYDICRHILEEAHPSLYWYTSRDSMNFYFNEGRGRLRDSLTEPEFRKVLSYVIAKINCGHTSVRPSRSYTKYLDTVRIGRIFPLSMKLWNDTMVVAASLLRQDSIMKRGTLIRSINGLTTKQLTDTLFNYISTDGYNTTHKYQSLSNRGSFGSMYTSLYGFPRFYDILYQDSLGQMKQTRITPYYPGTDTVRRRNVVAAPKEPQPSRRERRRMRMNNMRLLRMDTANHMAVMDLNSFSRGWQLKKFFRKSFKALRKYDIQYLVIDVRSNGGGSVTNSTNLTRYISDKSFVVADSLYAVTKRKKYSRYIESDFFNRMFMTFFTPRKKDGLYHFRYFERHRFKPHRKNHYDGQVYILIGGNSFSATTLFTGALIKQENVTVVGEETGGGAYGNSAWLIPDVTLPETGVRFRLPLFRLVIDHTLPKNGRGVQPEIYSGPTIEAIQRGADYKMEKVMQLIRQSQSDNEKGSASFQNGN